MMKVNSLCFVVLASLLTLAGCGEPSGDAGQAVGGKPVVAVSNYPLAYFAQRIAGDAAEVSFPEIDGDPAFWQPGDAQIAAMQGATLILTNGATYEKWAQTVSLPAAKTVDTSAAFAERFIEITGLETHSHGKQGEHSHAGTAFTTWMDLDQARQQAEAVRDALIKALPGQAEALRANAEALRVDIAGLDEAMRAVTAQIGDRPLVASHPVYQYLARRYGLDIESVLWEPETVPGDEDLALLRAVLADHPAAWMVWEGEPAAESVELLRAIGVASVVVDPAGNRPDAGDWLSVMRQNIENLRAVGGSAG